VLFKEQDVVFIDPNGQLQEHLAAMMITQWDVNQLGPTQQPTATAVGMAGGMGVATGVDTAGGMVAQAQPPGGAASVGNPPRPRQSTQVLRQPFVAWVTACTNQEQ
jgi:hypothetical protein